MSTVHTQSRRIAILTGGGDCPGLNAVIRAVTKKAIYEYGMQVYGVEYGYEGLVQNRFRELTLQDVSGILTLGGTILGTSNKTNPYKYTDPAQPEAGQQNVVERVKGHLQERGIDVLVCIGGDGTLSIANRLNGDGIPVVGIPKTIDNDIKGTEVTFGFDTAVGIVTEGIDRIHSTAQSHKRVMIIETMGRSAGWIALHAGVAGGGDVILLPEIPYDIEKVTSAIRHRHQQGKRFTIVVVAEGAKPVGGNVVIKRMVNDASEPIRLGGVAFVVGDQIEQMTGIETRAVVMGHLQRGGSPSSYDRILATRLGAQAVDLIHARQYGYMVGVRCNEMVAVALTEVAGGSRHIPLDYPLIESARALDTHFGDA